MKKSKVTLSVSKLATTNTKGGMDFDHILQRPSNQWSQHQKSLFIHSLVADYPIPQVYVVMEEDVYKVLDGKQRLTSILEYLDNEYKTEKNLTPIKIFDNEFDISNSYFKDLPQDVQTEFLNSSVDFVRVEEYTNQDITELFYRLNNGTQLTKTQQAKAVMSYDLNRYISECINHPFLVNKAYFTTRQLKGSENETIIIQTLMLFNEFNFKDFSQNTMLEYLRRHANDLSKESKLKIKMILNYINKCVDTKYFTHGGIKKHIFLKKINLPIILSVAKTAIELNIPVVVFKAWIEGFEKDYTSSGYRAYCGAGSIKKDKIEGRLSIATEHFSNFVKIEIEEVI